MKTGMKKTSMMKTGMKKKNFKYVLNFLFKVFIKTKMMTLETVLEIFLT
jgi:hypothetical protein